jgi:hypothetical protein
LNELILFIESIGIAWWGSLVVIAVGALAFLVLDRPTAALRARKHVRESEQKVA